MSDSSPLKIVVDCDASFPAADTPQRLIDALKRQLRKSSAAASALQNLGSERTLFGLIVLIYGLVLRFDPEARIR